MYTLRRLTDSEGIERNTSLGDWYIFLSAIRNRDELRHEYKRHMLSDMPNNIIGGITYNDGLRFEPLYEGSLYFIMTERGNTFDNLNKRL